MSLKFYGPETLLSRPSFCSSYLRSPSLISSDSVGKDKGKFWKALSRWTLALKMEISVEVDAPRNIVCFMIPGKVHILIEPVCSSPPVVCRLGRNAAPWIGNVDTNRACSKRIDMAISIALFMYSWSLSNMESSGVSRGWTERRILLMRRVIRPSTEAPSNMSGIDLKRVLLQSHLKYVSFSPSSAKARRRRT
jgi:hypothetical protein